MDGLSVRVRMGRLSETYPYRENRYHVSLDSHASAAMNFVRDQGLTVDYPVWHAERTDTGYVFVALASAKLNEYKPQFDVEQ
ncbi:hypothetical protein P3T25_005087 [Paraburkholderia sp. GAS32]